jgi:hypothetical protein
MLISEYNLGFGEGEMGWAPIMGIGYYRNVTTWHKGPSVLGCDVIQDDVAVISDVLGVKPDESLQIEKSNEISATTHGLINNSHDVDYYFVEVKKLPITISAIPMSLPNREGANLALKINVYDKKGKLEQTSYANGSLSASTTLLDKGKYFIGVETVASSNQSRYGMLGRYSLSMN